jgi:integrase
MSAHKLLSASSIKNVHVTGRERWLTDDTGLQGTGRLMLRVSPGGARYWFFRLPRGAGLPHKTIPLAPYSFRQQPGALTLSEAREQARGLTAALLAPQAGAALQQLHSLMGAAPGPDPTPIARPAPAAPSRFTAPAAASPPAPMPPPSKEGLTLLQVCRAYADHMRAEKKYSASKVSYAFDRLIAPLPIAQRLARDIESEELTEILQDVIEKHGKHVGNELRNYLSTAYQRAINAKTSLDGSAKSAPLDRSLRFNPVQQIRPAKIRSVRERKLKNSELREYWRCLNDPERAAELAVRAARVGLLLGGQRCEQLLRVTTLDVDLEAQTIRLFDPKGMREKPREHLLPLLPMARAEVEWLLAHCKALGSELLFASREDCCLHPGTVSKVVHQIYLSMQKAGTAEAHFQFSDIRRTLESYFASLKIPLIVRAHVQSHGLTGVQHVHYDRYEYMTEKRETLQLLEDFLSSFGVVHRTAAPYAPSPELASSHPLQGVSQGIGAL